MEQGRGRITAACLLAAAVIFTWRATVSWDTTVDDAWISARYAEHLANGHGLVYSHGEFPVEGYTNMGFTLLLAVGRMLGVHMHTLLTGVGYLFGLLAIVISVPLTRTLAGKPSWAELGVPLVLSLSPHLAVASTNGLESSMMVAMVLLATWSVLVAEGPWRWAAAAATGALVWTRPEGAVVAGLLSLYTLWKHRSSPRDAAPIVGSAIAALVSLTLIRMVIYGMFVPNTFFAKSSFPITNTFQINKSYLVPEANTLYAGLALWLVATVAPGWDARKWSVSAITLALGLIPLSVNLWMPGLRLFLAPLALSLCLVCAAAARLPKNLDIPVAILLVAAMAGFNVMSGERVRHYDWRHSVQPGNGTEIAAQHLAEHLDVGSVVATRDAGCLAYWVGTDVKVMELHNRALTQLHPEGKDVAVRDYTPANPEVFVATQRRVGSTELVYGNDRKVFQGLTEPYRYAGRVYQHYHRYYDIYVRADLEIPPLPPRIVENHDGPKPRKTVD